MAGVFAGVAWIAPAVLAWPNRIWTKFGELLHRLTSPIGLLAVYVVGIVPAGVIMRLIGKDSLRLKAEPELETYWIVRQPGDAPTPR